MRYVIPTLLAVAMLPTSALAQDVASRGLGISATVPEVCEIRGSVLGLTSPNTRISAQIFEMCNGAGTFRIIASHRGLETGEKVLIDYDGQKSELQAAGISDVAVRSGPFVGSRTVAINGESLARPISISLGLTPV